MEQEQWEEINEYEDKYLISNLGRIKNKISGKMLKQTKGNMNFLMVTLIGTDSVATTRSVHTLVAEHFVKWTGKKRIKFIDGDKSNCKSSNLIW